MITKDLSGEWTLWDGLIPDSGTYKDRHKIILIQAPRRFAIEFLWDQFKILESIDEDGDSDIKAGELSQITGSYRGCFYHKASKRFLEQPGWNTDLLSIEDFLNLSNVIVFSEDELSNKYKKRPANWARLDYAYGDCEYYDTFEEFMESEGFRYENNNSNNNS